MYLFINYTHVLFIHVCADGPFTGPQIGVGWGVIAFVTTARHDVKLRYAFVTTARHDVMLRYAFVTTARHDGRLGYATHGVGWGVPT